MITKKQLGVLDVFRKNLGKEIMFNYLKKEAKIKSNSFLQRTLSNLVHEGVITSKSVGKSLLYKLELNERTLAYFAVIASEIYALPEKAVYNMIQEISKTTCLFSLVIFGSYAKGENRKDSDLDMAVIVNNRENAKNMLPAIETVKRKEIIGIDCHVFTESEFKEMLASEKENVGKEILRNHIVFYNPSSFYRIAEKWIH